MLGEYLVAVSKSVVVDASATPAKARRNRLDVLLVVNDVLHADRYHCKDGAVPGNLAVSLQPYIENLAGLAAEVVDGKGSLIEQKLKAVINFWASSGCISVDDFKNIRERVEEGLAVAQGAIPLRKRTLALPEWHGDRNVAWHELPASYMVEPLLEHPQRPVPAKVISATRFDQKQPSDHVRKALETYFEDIDLAYVPTAGNPTGESKKYKLWLDNMGQLVKQNKENGETTTVCNAYGWSLDFCQGMQENGIPDKVQELREKHKVKAQTNNSSRWNSPPRISSRQSRSPPRRRYSSSSADRSRSRSRSSSYGAYNPDDRPRSRDNDRDKRDDRRRPSSRDDHRDYNQRSSRFAERGESERGRPASEYEGRGYRNDRQSRWNDNQRGGYQDSGRDNANRASHQPGFAPQGNFNQNLQPHPNPGGIPPPPPPALGQQYPGFPMPGFLPPHLAQGQFPAGAPPTQVPPPIPPNFQGQFPGAPFNMMQGQNNAYSYGNNASGHGHNPGYGGQPQGDARGGFRGGRGGYRGGYQGPYQGRGGRR